MALVRLEAGELQFLARLERELAPETCNHFESLLPFQTQFIHARWSGEACWVPLGDGKVPFSVENATSFPETGQMVFYPGGCSETELLLAYGPVRFACRLGQLAGNHFLTIVEGAEQLPTLGKRALWQGAQAVMIDRA